MAGNVDPDVDALVAAGRYAEAAEAALAAGDPARAAGLFERIWQFAAAARAARAAGDLPRALRAALDARDDDLGREIGDELAAGGIEDARAAIAIFERKRRFAAAAGLAERIGEREHAILLYRSADRDLDAARLLDALGRDREAGLLYERAVSRAASGVERATAHLRLGELLAGRLQHEAAIAHLQAALEAAETRAEARVKLVVELSALGLADAARDVLAAARADDPALPAGVDEVVRGARGGTRRAGGDLVAGRYALGKLIGSGATGRVHRARDEVSGREVALKLLAATSGHGSPAWERFTREARIASALRHPNLVEVYDVSPAHGYLAMELMVGGSLDARLEQPLPPAGVRRLGLEILAGLELAHQRGVIHRDVKPANVFFDARGTAKLGDFGVAHLLDLGQTQTGGLIGTLAYMSPEQVTGAPLTVAADLYSVGVTLFEALTGRPPFLGPDFVAQHLGEEPPTVESIAPEAAPGWTPLFARLLRKNPEERLATAAEVMRELQAVELGERPAALVLPRARPHRTTASQVAAEAAGPDEPRYQFETPLAQTPISALSRAVDRTLDRSVVIERFVEGAPDDPTAVRLLALARAVSPFFQRVLSFDRQTRVVVYEAPAGATIADHGDARAPSPRALIRLLKRLARALAVLHDHGHSHGALGPETVLIDDAGNPSILAAGLGPASARATPAADCQAILAAVGGLAGAGPSPVALIDALGGGLGAAERSALLAHPAPRHGEELFRFADALELSALRHARLALASTR